jgi:hypothetical protein
MSTMVNAMPIKVIETSTAERKQETVDIFNKVQPYLDRGYSLRQAVLQCTDRNITNVKNGWYRDLIEYCESQGYEYHKIKWSRGK